LLLENIRDITTAEPDIDQYLQKLTETACRLVGARYGALGVFDGEGKRLAQFFTAGMDEATRKAIGELPRGVGLLGALVHETRPLRLRDLTQHPASVGFPPNHPMMRSFLGVPIRAHGRLYGRLYLTEKRDADEFTEGDALTIDALAAQAGVAIENACLLRDAQRREEALRMSNQELENFTYAVSHDLQTPLRGIHGFADLLLKRIKDRLEPRELHYVERIQAGTRRMAEMVNDLLEYSRIERVTHPFEDVAMDDVLAQSLEDIRDVIRKAHAGVDIAKPLPVVWADRVRMGQVWTNLLTNAIKYAKDGVAPKIAIRWSETPQEFVFMVQDNGIGIAPEFHTRIFGLFHRLHTDEAYEGTGVGLAIVKRIVEFHKGRIWVESAEGQGSTFVFTIPKKTVSV
jgi:signal transduction histidine kinase